MNKLKKKQVAFFHGAIFSNNKGCEALSLSLIGIIKSEIEPKLKESIEITIYGLVPHDKFLHNDITYRKFPSTKNLFGVLTFIKEIRKFDLILDLSYGDGFSDIYGFKRLRNQFLYKILAIIFSKNLILTPQTIGPFYSKKAKLLGGLILKKANTVFSRDYISNEVANKYSKSSKMGPDLAFKLEKVASSKFNLAPKLLSEKIIGINVSGLLWKGGYSSKNEFNLVLDYKKLIIDLMKNLLNQEGVKIILVPHSFSEKRITSFVEDDYEACIEVKSIIENEILNAKIDLIPRNTNSSEIKHIISKTDFFIGSRMHSCIAAVSSKVPTISLSYSRKFKGLFSYLGYGSFVINLKENKWVDNQKVILEINSRLIIRSSMKDVLDYNDLFIDDHFHEFKETILNGLI